MADRLPDSGELSARLASRIDDLCRQLLTAGRRNGAYWQVGGVDNAKGQSMWVHLHGEKRGHWQDAATGEWGDALDLVAACLYHGNLHSARVWSANWLGITRTPSPQPVQARAVAHTAPAVVEDEEDKRRAAHAMWLHAEADIGGTAVESYLRGRGINLRQLGRFPRALRFHRGLYHRPSRLTLPAMVAAIAGPDGAHIATHRIWLDQAAPGMWVKARVDTPKMAFGPFATGSIRLWRGASGKPLKDALPDETIVIGEGIETCLSVVIACPELRVLSAVSLGNMGSVWLPEQVRQVILCADADDNAAARAAFQRAVERHMDAGRDVRIARPSYGKDFNDMLQGAA
jgi:hypothetical protein